MRMFSAPVAGANYTSDTRNYPWHRPPDISDYDEGVDYIITKLKEPEQHELVFSLIELDFTITTIVSTILMQGIARGKFPIDLAILIAGPIARYISIIADDSGLKYDMGLGDEDRIKITPTSLKIALGIVDDEEDTDTTPAEIMPDDGGLMSQVSVEEIDAASADEQASMLGETIGEEEPADGLA